MLLIGALLGEKLLTLSQVLGSNTLPDVTNRKVEDRKMGSGSVFSFSCRSYSC